MLTSNICSEETHRISQESWGETARPRGDWPCHSFFFFHFSFLILLFPYKIVPSVLIAISTSLHIGMAGVFDLA